MIKIIEVWLVNLEGSVVKFCQVFDESIIQTSEGHLVRLPELGSRLSVGEMGAVS